MNKSTKIFDELVTKIFNPRFLKKKIPLTLNLKFSLNQKTTISHRYLNKINLE